MILLNIILLLIIGALSYALYFCYGRIRALVVHMEKLGEGLEQTLDILEIAFQDINASASEHVLQDDAVTRRVVKSMFGARDSVLKVAKLLSNFEQSDTEEPTQNT